MGYKVHSRFVGTQQVRPDKMYWYQEVEYIWRNGNNYIDTWWIPKNSLQYEIHLGARIPTSWQRYCFLSNWDSNEVNGSVSAEINSGSATNNKARTNIKLLFFIFSSFVYKSLLHIEVYHNF